jgi:hypothetical protein
MAMIGFVLVLLPVVMWFLILANLGDVGRQRTIIASTALISLSIVVGYICFFGLETGDTWIGVLLLPVVPYAAVWPVLRFRVVEHRPGLILLFVPLAFVLALVAFVLLAVNAGLVGPPF